MDKIRQGLEEKAADTVKDFPTASEKVFKPVQAEKKTAMAIYDPKALAFASVASGAIGIHSAINLPTLIAGATPLVGGIGAVTYAAAAISLKNAHNRRQSRNAYDLGTLTSLGLSGYSAYRFRTTPHVTAMGLGAVGLASLIANGMKSYELRHGTVKK